MKRSFRYVIWEDSMISKLLSKNQIKWFVYAQISWNPTKLVKTIGKIMNKIFIKINYCKVQTLW